jgi:two-component system, chemotaxis family, protein-glutamate methylesterase/glutaminase
MDARDIVVIAASRGGFEVLRTMAAQLSADLPAAVFVVLHIGRHESVLPDLMTAWGPLRARYASDGEAVQRGEIRVAPPDRHLMFDDGRLWLNEGAKENFVRPAADPLFRSAARAYGPRVVGVVLSGDLDDGAAGLTSIRRQGGFAIVQDPDDCQSPGMPRAALDSCGADRICVAREIAACIEAAVRETPRAASSQEGGMTTGEDKSKGAFEREAGIAASGFAMPEQLDEIGERSALTCPDCGGVLWRMNDGPPLRYRCHTGHAFTNLTLEDGFAARSEEALWAAIRAVHERVIFARERQSWAERAGNEAQAALEKARIGEAEHLIHLLRQAIQVES